MTACEHNPKYGKKDQCAKCYRAAYYQAHKEHLKANTRAYRKAGGQAKEILKLSLPSGRAHYLWMNAKRRAKKAGVPFTITSADVLTLILNRPAVCPVLGIPWDAGHGRGKYRSGSMTLDRYRPALGYVPGNIFLISWRANLIKNCGTLAEMILITSWMRKHEKAASVTIQ